MLQHASKLILSVVLLLCATSAAALDNVTLQLKWTHAFQFAGYYAAKEQGYYRAAGLDVNILEAKPNTDPVRDVLEGKAQYGVGTSSLLLDRAAGKPVIALAVVFQQSPYEIYAAPNIRSLRDLIGKRIMLEPQSDELLAYLKREGIPLGSIQQIPHSYDANGLMDGKTEAIAGYISNEPFYFRQAHYPYQTFSPRSAGIDFYGDNLFTSEQELQSHPERVKAFRAASLRGWQYAKEHRDEVIALILAKYSSKHTSEYLHFESDQMIPLLQPNLIEIGYMNPSRWRDIAKTYADLNLLPHDFSLEGFLYDASEPDLTWFYRGLTSALIITIMIASIALYIHRINLKLRASEKHLKLAASVFNHANEGIMITSADGMIIDVNNAFSLITGYGKDEALGKNPSLLRSARQDAAFYANLWHDLVDKGYWRGEIWNRHKNGNEYAEMLNISAVRDDQGLIQHYVALLSDITERKQLEAKVQQFAFNDPLTNLPNRRLLNDRLNQAMAVCKRIGGHGALIILDLDNFKPLNDMHGHEVGDLLLIEAAHRMKSCVREIDTVARFGGDEFVVLLNELSIDETESILQAETAAEKIRTALSKLYQLTIRHEGNAEVTVEHYCTASIGVALFGTDATTSGDLLKLADVAMYEAKKSGRNTVKIAPKTQPPIGIGNIVATNFVKLSWRPAYKCGNALIDDQHRTLFDAANKLLTAVLSDLPTDQVAALINILIRDVVQHFKDEEAIIMAAGFPDVVEHAALHSDLVERAVNLVSRFNDGTLALGELFQFLAHDVIAQHMLGADRKFFPYLEEQRYFPKSAL